MVGWFGAGLKRCWLGRRVAGRSSVLLNAGESNQHGLLGSFQSCDGLGDFVLTRLKGIHTSVHTVHASAHTVHAGALTPVKSQHQADKGAGGGQAAHQ